MTSPIATRLRPRRSARRFSTPPTGYPITPYIHRPGRRPGKREAIVHPNYILVYRVGAAIDILAVLKARQQYP